MASDADAITALLSCAYAALLTPGYDPAVLPLITRANPDLLASGSFYVYQAHSALVACGGWSHTAPGSSLRAPGIAHLRHFATHPDHLRRGLGAAVFARCRQDAVAAGVHSFHCAASTNAEPFYATLGFITVNRSDILIAGTYRFPSVAMACTPGPHDTGRPA